MAGWAAMTPHPKIDAIVETYLTLADAEAPGLVEGLYLEGSAALGDYRPGTSDIDFVAVTSKAPPAEVLERIHTRLGAHPLEGVYLTWDDLGRDPAELGERSRAHPGRLERRGSVDPVTWHTLARHGLTCRGPKPEELKIWNDPASLAAWADRNLDLYWRRLVGRAARPLSSWGLTCLGGYGAVWIVTGVARLHYTLATGELTSKAGAARHALQTFPERWHRVVNEALRLREEDAALPSLTGVVAGLGEHFGTPRTSLYGSPFERRRDVLGFAEQAISAAHRLYRTR
ncbi:nucleotidyltransferase domain-containing protein [Nonomuraea sp. MG754425]|uniref:nucleotidyltransferase domain-containing protein n=1 Tax=Nonomuraea sp. MG754425 TaxID=2570319 RepID=UPI001F46D427|nr:nucleotidyltransferase domain-containing protein [Nonomuraea sp. MG754425]